MHVCMSVCARSVVSDSATPWTVARQSPLSMRFSQQEYSHGSPFPSPRDLPDPEIEPVAPALQVDSTAPPEKPGEGHSGL